MRKLNNWIKFFKLLTLLGFIGFIYKKPFYFFFWSYLIALFLQFFAPRSGKKNKEYSKYYQTTYLSLLNPSNFLLLIKQLTGQIYLSVKTRNSHVDPLTATNEVAYMLPFTGPWKVVNGGYTRATSHSWGIITQRYAYDFCIYDAAGKPYKEDGKLPEEYYCFSQPVISTADGVVVRVKDSIKDFTHTGTLAIDWRSNDFRGNFIIIQHAENEYSFTAHLQQHSLLVKEGDKVRQGQQIASCGNSGHSTMPHIHFHLQDACSFWFAAGIPIKFSNASIYNTLPPVRTETGLISANQIVSN